MKRLLTWVLVLGVLFAVGGEAAAQTAGATAAPSGDETVWRVPVGRSPARGPKQALVTLVVFSDFQCPYCKRLAPTLEALLAKYPKELRVVFKHNPLPFHKRAEPAAQLAIEAQTKKGDAGFWAAHDAMFARDPSALEDADLEEVARAVKIDVKRSLAAVSSQKHLAAIETDQALAALVGANGTPTSFVNGRKITGSQAIEKFEALIDEELAKANKLRAEGVAAARLYDHIIKDGKTVDVADKITVAAPTAANPTKGNKNAPVTIQIFTDFECPFCQRATGTLAEVEKRYKNKVRFVFRNMPLPFHKHARDAHIVAMEAFKQKGAAGFWKVHDLMFANQKALERQDLLGYAKEAGLNVAEVEKAFSDGRHDKAIDADIEAADQAGIKGTPAFVINDFHVSGAQPLSKFRLVIDAALSARGK